MAGLVSAAAAVGAAARTKKDHGANKLKAASALFLGKHDESSTLEDAFGTLRWKVLAAASDARLRVKRGKTVAADSFQVLRKSGSQFLYPNNGLEREATIQRLIGMGFSRDDAQEMSEADAIATEQLTATRDNSGNTVQAQMKVSLRNAQASVSKTKSKIETIIGKPSADITAQHQTRPPQIETGLAARHDDFDAKRKTVYEATERRLVQEQARNGGTMEDWRRQRLENQNSTVHKHVSTMGYGDHRSEESPSSQSAQLASSNVYQGMWLGADEVLVSEDELALQRAIAASLGTTCAEPLARISVSSVVSSSSSSSSSCGSSTLMEQGAASTAEGLPHTLHIEAQETAWQPTQRDFKKLPSVATWLVLLPVDLNDPCV